MTEGQSSRVKRTSLGHPPRGSIHELAPNSRPLQGGRANAVSEGGLRACEPGVGGSPCSRPVTESLEPRKQDSPKPSRAHNLEMRRSRNTRTRANRVVLEPTELAMVLEPMTKTARDNETRTLTPNPCAATRTEIKARNAAHLAPGHTRATRSWRWDSNP